MRGKGVSGEGGELEEMGRGGRDKEEGPSAMVKNMMARTKREIKCNGSCEVEGVVGEREEGQIGITVQRRAIAKIEI